MIEMSVDKETVLPSERPGGASLPPPPQQHSLLHDKRTEDPQQPSETTVQHSTKEDEACNLGERGDNKTAFVPSQAALDLTTQNQNGVQLPKPQQRLNKRRSTMNSGFKHPIFGKRRRRATSESESVLPTNFLLGGNIFDPLNLNSLLDEEVNRALNAETPKSSPLPAKSRDPVEILIPRDITDPLNLNCCTAGDGGLLLTPLKSGGSGRRRHRNRHHGGAAGLGGTGRGSEGTVTQFDVSDSEKGKVCSASQTELALVSSGPPLASEAATEDVLESNAVPAQEAQCPSGPNSTAGREEKDEKPVVSENATPSTTVTPTTHRQRKRKRTTSKSENFGAPCWDKNKAPASGSGSGRQPQPNRAQGMGPQGQQQHPNHRRQQRNQQKPIQQHQQQNKNQQPQRQQQKKKFQYGNYDKYYGYRNPGSTEDPRLHTLKPEWFKGKEVLDLGCNTGRITLTIAKNWQPSRIVGLDIDGSLIHAAKQNIRYYLSEMQVLKARSGGGAKEKLEEGKEREKDGANKEEEMEVSVDKKESAVPEEKTDRPGASEEEKQRGKDGVNERVKTEEEPADVKGTAQEAGSKQREEKSDIAVDRGDDTAKETAGERDAVRTDERKAPFFSSNGNHLFPVSLRISRGPIAAPPLPETPTLPPGDFPANVTFVKGNYVLDSDALLLTQHEEFDVILCLSVTKWVHLNWGDAGLKRLFQRVYRHLRPGGLFILEPQPWHSYSKRKKLTESISKNYYSICFKPEQFSSYLTSEVGFSSYELIGTPNNLSRGFQRPIYVFHKGPAPRQ
ncbi:7SK snRNA methylphosphate capping enzyme [Colossoma macropomum]|uniref:7SK snRNA methylphosphate capping enzyme n=1 Tax=Colossoma macropomum TaxID=42526 RepID=UPI001863A54F|nr:7SK snRNA methylphosphate capping enzyme [Colossoma macropomum]XP_036436651.1 7SK snRNA methylphosphate capping enzyme [Colossoma macropomum]